MSKEVKMTPVSPQTQAALAEVMTAFEAFKSANDQRLEEVERRASADILLATALLDSIGASVALVPTATHVHPAGAERFYLVAAVVDSTAVDHRAFKVGFAAGGVASRRGHRRLRCAGRVHG